MQTMSGTPAVARRTSLLGGMIVLVLVFAMGLAACDSDVGEVLDAVGYINATSDVLEANGFDGASTLDMDCDDTGGGKNVTCTGETAAGESIESRGEDVGADSATLVVTVEGEVLYDGLLKDAPGS